MNKNDFILWNENFASDVRRKIIFNSFPKRLSKEKKYTKIIIYLEKVKSNCKNKNKKMKAIKDSNYYQNQLNNYLQRSKKNAYIPIL
ncbi:MAG TPA: hypothetical protein VJ895_01425 [Candidatus Nanoarchaeia archaeon]|nr:hypothetical protein [Candidatus Nanoarchaeia archaeon]